MWGLLPSFDDSWPKSSPCFNPCIKRSIVFARVCLWLLNWVEQHLYTGLGECVGINRGVFKLCLHMSQVVHLWFAEPITCFCCTSHVFEWGVIEQKSVKHWWLHFWFTSEWSTPKNSHNHALGQQLYFEDNYMIILEVGYTGVKKGSCFKFLRTPSHMKQNVALSILPPFTSKSAKKNEKVPPKNPKLDEEGRGGGLKLTIYVIILVLYSFSPVLKLVCMLSRSRNPFCKVLKK